MKKILAALTLLIGTATVTVASDLVLQSSAVVNAVLVPSKNVDVDLNANRVDELSVQVVYSSASPSTITFGDGTPGHASIRVASLTGLTTAYATNNITVASNGAGTKAYGTVTILSTASLSGVTLTVNGNTFKEGSAWIGVGNSTSTTDAARHLAAVLAASSGYTNITASSGGNIVYTTATAVGLAGNSYSMGSSNTSVMLASSTLTGGLEKDNYHAILTISAGGRTVALQEGSKWTQMDTASNTAISINTALRNAFNSVFLSTVTAGDTVIYSTAVAAGTAGNAYTCVSSNPSGIACGAATFTGGQDNATITINNVVLQANRDWYVKTTTITTATDIVRALNASVHLSSVLVATNTAAAGGSNNGIVYTTATIVGKNSNFTLASSATGLVATGFTGGANADLTLQTVPDLFNTVFNYSMVFPGDAYGTTNTINETPTGFGIGTELLYTKTAGTTPTGLVANTTYYATNLTGTSFQLSDTSTGAVAGLAINITNATQAGGGTFVLTPLALSGTASFKIQKSNDGTNFQDIYVSTNALVTPFAASVSFASPYTASNQVWDLGQVLFRYIRLAYTAATHGGTNIKYILNGKKD